MSVAVCLRCEEIDGKLISPTEKRKRKDASRLGQGKETLGQGWEAEATSYLFGRPGSLGRLPVQTSRISFISGRHQVVCPGRIIDLLVPFPP